MDQVINFSLALAFLLDFYLAGLIFIKSQKKESNIVFAISTLCVGLWTLGIFMFRVTDDLSVALFWNREFIFTSGLIASTFLHFSLALANFKLTTPKRIAIHLPNLFILFFVFIPNAFIRDIVIREWGKESLLGYLYPAFNVYFSSYIIMGLYEIFRELRKAEGLARNQLQYILLATLLTSIIGTYFNLYLILMGNYQYIWVGPYNSLVLVSIVAYAITRYRLMDIQFIIRKGMIYGLITAVMSVLYFIVIYLSEHFFKAVTGFSSLWFTIPAIFILALLFEPTMAFLQGAVDRTFFRSRYIAEKISRKFAEGVKKLRTIEDFAKFIARSAYVTLKLKGSAAFAFDERKGLFVCLEAKGSLKGLKDRHIRADDPCVSQMRGKKSSVMREETKMPDDNIYLCVPSMSSGKSGRLLGFLAADTKRDNTPFSVEEIELLEMLANQTASGIENALLYEQQIATIEKSLKLEKLASLGEATAGVAHEAKNALGFIATFAQMLLKTDDKPKLAKTHSEAFANETNRIKLILQGIQDYSKQTEQLMEVINIKELADETIVLVRDQAKGKNVIIDNAAEEGVHITADRNRMKQVLLNLFMNAIEAMASGGVLSISTERGGQDIAVKVADTGSGMTKETLRRIFEPFYTTKKQGTGLGLAIVKRIVEENNGRLTADSEPGKGTTFTLAFQT